MDQELAFVEVKHAGARWAVVWMHGLGADGSDFEPVAKRLGPQLPRPARWLLPHAPVMPITINGGMPMRAWYDIKRLDGESREIEPSTLEYSYGLLEAFLEQEVFPSIPPERTILAGFSQGGSLALHAALRGSRPFAGIIVLSSFWLDIEDAANAPARHPEVPIFMAHGTDDPIIPAKAGRQSAEALQARSFELEYHEYQMPHQVCDEELADLLGWMQTTMKRSPEAENT